MTTATQSDVMSMSAGLDLSERVCIAIDVHHWLNNPEMWPGLLPERLRRLLGLPPTHPVVELPTYAGPAWSTDNGLMDDVLSNFSLTGEYDGADTALAKARWFVCRAMNELEME